MEKITTLYVATVVLEDHHTTFNLYKSKTVGLFRHEQDAELILESLIGYYMDRGQIIANAYVDDRDVEEKNLSKHRIYESVDDFKIVKLPNFDYSTTRTH